VTEVGASAWSDVDAGDDPGRLVAGLDRLRADPFFASQKQRLHAELDVRPGQRVVDIGCGTGDDTAGLARAAGGAVGVDRSRRLLDEARRRHPSIGFVLGDARGLPVATASVDRVGVDRVVQHLDDADRALREWRRVLRPGGVVAMLEPDVMSARIEGLDADAARVVCEWRAATRPGAAVVRDLAGRLADAGFDAVTADTAVLELVSLDRADSMMGLPDWGEAAGAAGALAPAAAARWRADAVAAAERGRLRFSTTYLLVSARV
jgi:SAM-dependent methyltransferase